MLWAYDFQSGDLYYTITSNVAPYTVEVTSGNTKYSGDITIPSSVTYNGITYAVTSIGIGAFSYCSSLTSVTIPNGVTRIGNVAFQGCSSLTSVSIPNSVTSIGYNAFYYCVLPKDKFINNSVCTSNNNWGAILADKEQDGLLIKDNIVVGCKRDIKMVTIPNGIVGIGNYAFWNCTSLTSVTIPNSVTSIGDEAFRNCSSLPSVTIPNSVTSIGTSAFSHCSSFTSVTIPSSVTSIELSTFEYCSSLTSVTIPNSVTSIGYWAFYYCTSLTSVTIPSSVTSIGGRAFYNCSSLTSVTIPNSVTSIGYWAFRGCSSLTSVTIPNSVTSIGGSAFESTGIFNDNSNWENGVLYISNCLVAAKESLSGVYTIKNGTRIIADYAFRDCSSLTSVTIPNSVTSIAKGAFSGCSSLTSVTIPNSVTSIGDGAFDGTSIYNNESYWENGCMYMGNCLIKAKDDLTGTYTIKNGTQIVLYNAFEGCSFLTSITIPNSVTCIGNQAFRNCTSLTSISIPNSVIYIEEASLAGCPALSRIIVENGNPVYDSRNNCNAIVETATNTLIAGCKNTIIPNTVTTIGRSAFWYCSTLTSITIPNSVKTIGVRAFVFCPSLTSIKIPKSVTKIEGAILTGCNSATSIVVEEGNPNYDSRDNCNAIIETGTNTLLVGCQNTVIPKSITTIKEYAFAYSTYPSIASNATTPPIVDGNTFFSRETPITVYIPCGTKSAYEAVYWAEYVGEFVENDEFHFDFKVSSADESMGNAVITQEPGCETAAIIAATPNDGYTFTQWSDGNTDNPRTLTVTEDMKLTAEFEQNNGSYSRNVRIGYNTICLPHGSSNFTGATFYEIAHILKNKKKIFFDEVKTLEAGKPYIFYPHSNEVTIYYDNTTSAIPLSHNGLHGTFDGITAASNFLKGKYLVAGDRMVLCGDGCSLAANRAYIVLDEISDKDHPAIPGIKRVSMDYSEENATTALDNITDESIVAPMQEGVYDILGRKVDAPTVSGFYIINGKKVFVAL